MGALIPIFLQYLPQLIKAAESVPEIIGYIQRTKATLEQSDEWTPAQEDEFNQRLELVTNQPWWKPEA